MRILCDTCSVLMVVRIAPEMFVDERYRCVTIPSVYSEIFRTQKFKTKYPWRDDYRSKIVPIGIGAFSNSEIEVNLSTISLLVDAGVLNSKTGRLIDLSRTDKEIVACAAAHKYEITSGDGNLVDFAEQQFDISNVSPLGLVNEWLEEGLISWDERMQMVIEDWEKCGENPQSKSEAGRYQRITRKFYVGP